VGKQRGYRQVAKESAKTDSRYVNTCATIIAYFHHTKCALQYLILSSISSRVTYTYFVKSPLKDERTNMNAVEVLTEVKKLTDRYGF